MVTGWNYISFLTVAPYTKQMNIYKLNLVIFVYLISLPIYAKSNNLITKPINQAHKLLSSTLVNLSDQTDLLLSGKSDRNSNNTYLKISHIISKTEHIESEFQTLFQLKVDLPNSKNKFQLLIDKTTKNLLEDERSTTLDTLQVEQDYDKKENITDTLDDSDYSATLRRIWDIRTWKFETDIGLKIKIPLDSFLRITTKKEIDLNLFQLYFSEKIYWFYQTGVGQKTIFDVNRKLGASSLFRFGTVTTWSQEKHFFNYRHGFYLFNNLSKNHKILSQISANGDSSKATYLINYLIGSSYIYQIKKQHHLNLTLNAYGITRETPHINYYLTSVSYRYLLYQNWLYITLNPYVRFYKDKSFKPTSSIVVKIESLFGVIN